MVKGEGNADRERERERVRLRGLFGTIGKLIIMLRSYCSLLGHHPHRQTRIGCPGPRRAIERPRRRGQAHRGSRRVTPRDNGPGTTRDRTRGHGPPVAEALMGNRYHTATSTREVEDMQPGDPGGTPRGTGRTTLYVRRRVEGIRPDRSDRTEQRRDNAVGATPAPRSTARLTF